MPAPNARQGPPAAATYTALVWNRQARRMKFLGSPLFIGQRHRRKIFRMFDHPTALFSDDSIEATDGNSGFATGRD